MQIRSARLIPTLALFALAFSMFPPYVAPAYAEAQALQEKAVVEASPLSTWELEKQVYGPPPVDEGGAGAKVDRAVGRQVSPLPLWYTRLALQLSVPEYVQHIRVQPAFGPGLTVAPAASSARIDSLLPGWFVGDERSGVGTPVQVSVGRGTSGALLPDWFAVEASDFRSNVGDSSATVSRGGVNVAGPDEVYNCQPAAFTIVIANNGVTVTNVAYTSSMPTGSFNPTEIFQNLGTLTPNQVVTLEHVFSATCNAVSGQHQFVLSQDDAEPIVVTTDYVVRPGAITLRKEPSVIDARVGDEVVWTVLAENTGYGPVHNVSVSDVLSTGLQYTSGLTQAFYDSIPVGETRSFTVAAEVVGCSQLENDALATWGCGGTPCQTETSKASIDLKVTHPVLSYNPPSLDIDYCSNSGAFTMPISNVGDGQAKDVFIGVDLTSFVLDNINGAVYTTTPTPGFLLDDLILPGGVFTLTFEASFTDACGSGTGGSLTYRPLYYDSCDNPYLNPVDFGNWRRTGNENVPILSVDKSMPATIQIGEVVTAVVTLNTSNITTTITVTDTAPDGWSVADADGGAVVVDGDETYVVWSGTFEGEYVFRPVFTSPVPGVGEDACDYCGQSSTNAVEAFAPAAGCQGCSLEPAVDSATTEIQCDIGVAGAKQVSPASAANCSTFSYTNTYNFGADVTGTTWSTMVLTESLSNDQDLMPGTVRARVISGSQTYDLDVFTSTAGGSLVVTFGDLITAPVAGATLIVAYDLETTPSSQSPCSNRSWFDWTYFDSGASTSGPCGGDGTAFQGVYVTSLAPAMNVGFSGLPDVVNPCGTYTVTLSLNRTSSVAAYATTLNVATDTYAVVEVIGFGTITPVATTTDASGWHFDYGDQFTSATQATVDLVVELGCGAAGTGFRATAEYDNNCGATCSTGGTLESPLLLEPQSVLNKYPEVIYATGDIVTWTLTIVNAGAGTAYGVTITDALGAGLRYVDSSMFSTFSDGVLYEPITSSNVVTWPNVTCEPGEKKTVQLAAEIIGCEDLTNKLHAQHGCHGAVCTACGPIPSRVVLPGSSLINTNRFVNPLPQCLTRTVTATVRNAGLLSVYSATVKESLPAGASYVISSTEYAVGLGSTPPVTGWTSGGEPAGVPDGPLQWTANEIPNLARLYPKETVWVRFVLRAGCDFDGGAIRVQTSYQDVCGSAKSSSPSDFVLAQLPPQVSPQKQGRNLTVGSGWSDRVYAEPGDVVEWRLRLTNSSDTPAFLTVVTDTLPSNQTYSATWPTADGVTGQVITWNLGDLTKTTWTALLTTTVNDDSCTENDTTNAFTATWGCDDGCREQKTSRAYLRTRPLLADPSITTTLSGHTLPGCGGVLTISFRNDGPPAYGVVLSNLLSSGFVYSETVYSTTAPTSYPAAGDSLPAWAWDKLPTGLSEVAFRVVPGLDEVCASPVDGSSVLTITYDAVNACTTTGPYTLTGSQDIDVITPALQLSKTPLNQSLGAGGVATWTIALTNVGAAAAENLTIIDRLGDGFDSVGVLPADGILEGDGPFTVTWTGVNLDATDIWTRQVTATVRQEGLDQRNTVEVVGTCEGGCTYAAISETAYVAAFGFAKLPQVQTATIGVLVQHTIVVSYFKAMVYSNAFVVDVLPPGLRYYTSTKALNGGAPVPAAPTITSGNVLTFAFGSGTGPVEADIVITSVVRNLPGNQDGTELTNEARFVWNEKHEELFIPFVETYTARVDVVEPLLSVNKAVRSSSGSTNNLDGTALLTYTVRLTNSGNSPAFEVSITDVAPAGISVTALYGGDGRSAPIVGSGVMTWTVGVISHTQPGTNNPLVLTYTARLSAAAASGAVRQVYLDNVVTATYSSLLGDPPPGEEREYGPISDSERVNPAQVTTTKRVEPASSSTNNLKIGDVVTYTLVNEVPPGLVAWWPYQYDTLPAGLRYVTGSLAFVSDIPYVGGSPLATGTQFVSAIQPDEDRGVVGVTASSNPNVGAMAGQPARQALEWWLQPLNNGGSGTVGRITITFRAQLVGTRLDTGAEVWNNQVVSDSPTNNQTLHWIDANAGGYTTTLPTNGRSVSAQSRVGQPQLSILKSAEPPDGTYVEAGEWITYTLAVSNVGRSPAFDIVITDALPGGIVYQSVDIACSSPATASLVQQPTVGATGAITFAVDQLDGLDAAVLEAAKRLTLTFVTQVTDTIGSSLLLRNAAALPYYDTQPGTGPQLGLTPTQRTYADGNSAVEHYTIDAGIFKTVTPATATLGNGLTYVIRVPQPPITATLYAVTVTDVLDGRLQPGAVDAAPDGVVAMLGNAFTVTYASITNGQQRNITVTAVLSDPLGAEAGEVITNVAHLVYRDGGPLVSNESVFTVTEPSLVLGKSSDPAAGSLVVAGQKVTYTVLVTNANGITASAAYDVAFEDIVPDGMRGASPVLKDISINGAMVPPESYAGGWNAGTGQYTLTVVSPTVGVPPGGVFRVVYVATVDANVSAGIQLENLASVNWSNLGGPMPGDRAYGPVTDSLVLETPSATGLFKAVDPADATVGSQVIFTVTLPTPPLGATIFNVVLTDVVDSRLRMDDIDAPGATSVDVQGNRVVVQYASIPVLAQRIVLITATVQDLITVTAGTDIPNQARLDYANNPGGIIFSDVVTTTVHEPDVVLEKSLEAVRSPVGAGDVLTYTLVAVNNGGWSAFDVVLTDAIPSGISFLDTSVFTVSDPLTATLTDSNSEGSSLVSYGVSQVNPGGSITVVLRARVNPDIGAGVTLVNAAGGVYDSQPGVDPDERVYTIVTETVSIESGLPALSLRKAAGPLPAMPGDALTYTIRVTNSGIVSATGVVITDRLPSIALATYVRCGPTPCQHSGGVVTWPVGVLNVDEERLVHVVITPNLGLLTGTLLVNSAVVTSSEGMRADDVVTTAIQSGHTFNLVKSSSPLLAQAGGVLEYALNWRVVGVQDALGVVVRDTVPLNTRYLECGPVPCQLVGDEVVWELGDQSHNAQGVVTFTVAVTEPLFSGSLLTNTALISDVSEITGTDYLETPVTAHHTLMVSKEVTPDLVMPSGLLTYTIAYTVAGNGSAANVTVSDATPAGTTYYASVPEADIHPAQGSGGAVRWLLGDLLPPASGVLLQQGVLTVVVRADFSLPNGARIENTVIISDDSGLTDSDRATVTVESSQVVTITKQVAVEQAARGDLITYTMYYTIAGNAPSTAYIRDDVGAPLTFVSATGGISVTHPAVGQPGTVMWHLGTVTPTETTPVVGSVGLVVRVSEVVTDGQLLLNEVTLFSGSYADGDVVTTPLLAPTMHLLKRSSASGPLRPGDAVTYTVCASNTGAIPGTNAVITDYVPFNTTYEPGSVMAGAWDVSYYDGQIWQSTEPLTVAGVRFSLASMPPDGLDSCVSFGVRVNPVVYIGGMGMELTAVGWRPITATGGISITPTLTPTPTQILTPTMTATATATVMATPAASVTVTPAVTVTLTPSTTATATALPTPTASATGWFTPTQAPATPAVSPTAAPSMTWTPIPMPCPTPGETATSLPTAPLSPEPPLTPTESSVASPTPLPSSTAAQSPESTPVVTPLATGSATEMAPESVGEDQSSVLWQRIGFWPVMMTFLSAGVLFQPVEGEDSVTPTVTVQPTATTASPVASTEQVPTATMAPATATVAVPPLLLTPAPSATMTPETSPTDAPPPPAPPPDAAVNEAVMSTVMGSISNTATLGTDQTFSTDSTVDDPLWGTVDPFLDKSVKPTEAKVGEEVTYTLVVGNRGDTVARNVILTDALPIYLDVLFAESTMGTVRISPPPAPRIVVVEVAQLAPGDVFSVTIGALVNRRAEPGPTDVANQAELGLRDVPDVVFSERVVVHVPKSHSREEKKPSTPTPVVVGPTPTATPTQVLLPVGLLPQTGALPDGAGLFVLLVFSLAALVGGALVLGVHRRRIE
jgi:uncharacterized repeat protein (TIGR01451 family)